MTIGLILALTTTAKANCADALEACDLALQKADEYIFELNEVNRIKEDKINEQAKLINNYEKLLAEREKEGWYDSPLVVGSLGIVIGVVLGGLVTR